MLNANQSKNLTPRAKEEIKKILQELKIESISDENICILQNKLDLRVSSMVSAKEDGEVIEDELLTIYDLLVDIVVDNEDNLGLLNDLFLG